MSEVVILNTKEAAAKLRISTKTLMVWVKEGKIKVHRKASGRAPNFFLESEVERVLKAEA